MGERRFDYRAEKPAKAAVQWTDATQQTITAAAIMADLSPTGARFHLDRAVPVLIPIRIALESGERSGTVRWCVKRLRGYAMGVQFDAPAAP